MSRRILSFSGPFPSIYTAAYTYPLDLVAGATGGWSTRKLQSAYSGNCMQVQRSTPDTTTLDIGFNGNLLDTAAILSFIGAGNGTISIWYDQSGNGRNLIQASSSERPRIATGGAIVTTIGSQPSVQFSDTNYLTTSGAISNLITTTVGTILSVIRPTNISDANANIYNNHAIWCDTVNANNGVHLSVIGGIKKISSYNYDGNQDIASITVSESVSIQQIWRHGSSNLDNFVNSSTPTTVASGTCAGLTGLFRTGMNYNGNFGYLGEIVEIISYNTALSGGDLGNLGQTLASYYGLSWS